MKVAKKGRKIRRRGKYRSLRWSVIKILMILGFLAILLSGRKVVSDPCVFYLHQRRRPLADPDQSERKRIKIGTLLTAVCLFSSVQDNGKYFAGVWRIRRFFILL